MSCSLLTLFSLLGLGLGMTTAFAQRLQRQKTSVSTRRTTAPRPFTLSVERTFSQHQQTVRTLTWSPDEAMVASGGNDDLAFVWKRDGTVLSRLSFKAHVRAVAWSLDSTQLVSGTANTISFFDAQTGSLLAENAEQHVASITSVGWTLCGRLPLLQRVRLQLEAMMASCISGEMGGPVKSSATMRQAFIVMMCLPFFGVIPIRFAPLPFLLMGCCSRQEEMISS